eukprot:TRINITY_DN6643_c0_g1_i1.p2 TRINITY_DN6643_c0_g1~~TRINITY_DN6643_c0_g1_i1.p2  ORF type:complete len:214 (+),score=46.94 TRINITY_DN6643_c0_g1_i1:122-763(+)
MNYNTQEIIGKISYTHKLNYASEIDVIINQSIQKNILKEKLNSLMKERGIKGINFEKIGELMIRFLEKIFILDSPLLFKDDLNNTYLLKNRMMEKREEKEKIENSIQLYKHTKSKEISLNEIKRLISLKADVWYLQNGNNSFHNACRNENASVEMIAELFQNKIEKVDAVNHFKNSPLSLAIQRSNFEIAKYLMEIKADINLLNSKEKSPFCE